jgi:hypothetical protein
MIELKLMFADCLDFDNINSLVRTNRVLNRLATRYMYRRAEELKSRNGRPYVLEAIHAGHLTAVGHFIEVGSSVNMSHTVIRVPTTALHSWVEDRNIQIALLLIQHGVNIAHVNHFGWMPSHDVVSGRHCKETWVGLLMDTGADISASSRCVGRILSRAVIHVTPQILQRLLQRGAIPTVCNSNGDTLLHCPQWKGTAATVVLRWKQG